VSGPIETAKSIAALAAEHASDAERAGQLSTEVRAALVKAGFYRLCVPESVGGLEAHPAVLVEVVETLARGDTAPGWIISVCATAGLLSAYIPPDAARAIYGRPESVVGGVFAPRGRAVPDADATSADGTSFGVTGRWPFASGCLHADWFLVGCVVQDGDGVRTLPNGMPDVRLMLAPTSAYTIHDTWDVTGLRATGSNDVSLDDQRIPLEHSGSVLSDQPVSGGTLYAFPLFGLLAIAIAGVGLGAARGALDDLTDLARAKTPTAGRRTLAERSTVQAEMARAEASLRAARAGLYEAITVAWDAAVAEGVVPVSARTGLRLAATHAAAVGAHVTHAAYLLGGGTAIYGTSPLQRRYRDANVATQHMLVAPATWELTGRLLLGLDTDVTQL
jgi:alkylation response protein AidB-like acyl-CoA dehydrogenase